ncbi:hypothetical protein FNH22_13710 [Fulvivirga sp. M361]|uniref:hypothetical protein n=1 Tax=Fulvivirga sp. M361 TaxID=2594266 RepID=UPI00117ACCA8|nr:hypothetical protein [Fulvivirga sp. M361]TRX58400.1 hypothetical protein FNH22_13710 [Fulvivirga sp. M361]
MTKTFTQDDVIRYLYQETAEKESNEIEKAMLCDARLQEMYKEFALIKKDLSRALKQPSERVINSILNYSKSLNLPSKP